MDALQPEVIERRAQPLALVEGAVVGRVGRACLGQLDAAELDADDRVVARERLDEGDPGPPAAQAAGDQDDRLPRAGDVVQKWGRYHRVFLRSLVVHRIG